MRTIVSRLASKWMIAPAIVVFWFVPPALAQTPNRTSASSEASIATAEYRLGPDDQLVVQGVEADELVNKPVRIDSNGLVNLPMVGRIQAGGLTIREFEDRLNTAASRFIKGPQLTVSVAEMRSQPVSIFGAVNSPGMHQIQGRKTLIDMVSMAGGLRQDAGYSLILTRDRKYGPIPLPGAGPDSTGNYEVAEVKLKDLMEARNPAANILVKPHDVVSIPRAQMVYVIGEVRKSGGFILGEHETVSVLQVLSLAEGIERTAAPQNAKIMRSTAGASERKEIPVDVKRILAGKSPDVPLQGADILFIPGSTGKRAMMRSIEAAIQTGSGVVIWGARR